MKKLVITLILLLSLFGTCYAEDNQGKASKDLLDKYLTMTYVTNAGINRLDYEKEYRDLYISTQKSKDKITKEQYELFSNILGMYDDVKDIWQNHYPVINYETKDYLQKKYPEIKKHITADIIGNYYTKEVIPYIWSEAEAKTKELQKNIETKD